MYQSLLEARPRDRRGLPALAIDAAYVAWSALQRARRVRDPSSRPLIQFGWGRPVSESFAMVELTDGTYVTGKSKIRSVPLQAIPAWELADDLAIDNLRMNLRLWMDGHDVAVGPPRWSSGSVTSTPSRGLARRGDHAPPVDDRLMDRRRPLLVNEGEFRTDAALREARRGPRLRRPHQGPRRRRASDRRLGDQQRGVRVRPPRPLRLARHRPRVHQGRVRGRVRRRLARR